MIRRLAIAALVVASAAVSAGGQTVTLRDAGPGPGPRILRGALAAPHLLVTPTSGQSDLPLDKIYNTTVIIVGHDATVASTVHGDVIVVGGDLFLHPGARVDGRTIAFGGAVYNSSLAMAGGDRLSFREFTYVISEVPGGYALDYRWIREQVVDHIAWPLFGLRIPGYDRSNGLSAPVGPTITLDTGAIVFEPRVTYRSQLGVIDPSVDADLQFTRRFGFRAFAARGTFSNDTWIYGNFVNAASSFFLGNDTRNYFRADRGEVTAHLAIEGTTAAITPYLGGRWERSWSVRPDLVITSGPWSLFGRRDIEDMFRLNPPVDRRSIASLLTGFEFNWESQGLRAELQADEEYGFATSGDPRFAQTTLDGYVRFTTFGGQRFRLDGHAVLTAGTPPRQRYAYLGGAGTIPLMELLQQGGDQLLFLDSRYDIPIDAVAIPFLGPPTIGLRHIMGSAGIGSLPALEQRVGLRLSVNVLRVEFLVDPSTRDNYFGLALAVGR